MALRIQRERMAAGLLPSLREYAARYGLTRERLRAASPDVVVMHPGPMNEGVEIAADVAVDPRSVITDPGHQRRRGADGAPVPARRHAARAGPVSRPVMAEAGEVGAVADDATLRGWVVDPSSGREGAGEVVVRDGRLDGGVRWLAGADADGLGADGVLIAPGFLDLHAHFREPGNEDAETVATGLAAAAHGGFTTVCLMPNTTPAIDDPSVVARIRSAAEASGRRCGCSCTGR